MRCKGKGGIRGSMGKGTEVVGMWNGKSQGRGEKIEACVKGAGRG